MERIEINGQWYVRETPETQPMEQHELSIILDPTHTENLIYESDKYCFEVSRIYRDDESFYDGVCIDFTDKRLPRAEWKTEYWDNDQWMIGVFEGDEEALEGALIGMDEQGVKELQAIVGDLIARFWITIDEREYNL
jgi:hypothetical protein